MALAPLGDVAKVLPVATPYFWGEDLQMTDEPALSTGAPLTTRGKTFPFTLWSAKVITMWSTFGRSRVVRLITHNLLVSLHAVVGLELLPQPAQTKKLPLCCRTL